MENSSFKVPIKLHHTYLCGKSQRWCKWSCSCQIAMFYFCQSSICLYSTPIRRFQVKLLTFFLAFRFQTSSSSCWASQHPPSFTHKFFIWLNTGRKHIRVPDAELRPQSSLIRDRVHKLLKQLCPPNKFTTEAEGAVAQGWGFEERMKLLA